MFWSLWRKLWKSISQKTLNYSFVVVVLFIIHARTVHFEMYWIVRWFTVLLIVCVCVELECLGVCAVCFEACVCVCWMSWCVCSKYILRHVCVCWMSWCVCSKCILRHVCVCWMSWCVRCKYILRHVCVCAVSMNSITHYTTPCEIIIGSPHWTI